MWPWTKLIGSSGVFHSISGQHQRRSPRCRCDASGAPMPPSNRAGVTQRSSTVSLTRQTSDYTPCAASDRNLQDPRIPSSPRWAPWYITGASPACRLARRMRSALVVVARSPSISLVWCAVIGDTRLVLCTVIRWLLAVPCRASAVLA